MTRGPSGLRMTCSGPKLPCTSPAWCTAASPVALPDGQRVQLQAAEPAAVGHRLEQRAAGHVLADQVGVVLVGAEVHDPGGAERRHPPGRAGLGGEPVPRRRIVRPGPAQQPDRQLRAVRPGRQVERPGAGQPRDAPVEAVPADPVRIFGSERSDFGHRPAPPWSSLVARWVVRTIRTLCFTVERIARICAAGRGGPRCRLRIYWRHSGWKAGGRGIPVGRPGATRQRRLPAVGVRRAGTWKNSPPESGTTEASRALHPRDEVSEMEG